MGKYAIEVQHASDHEQCGNWFEITTVDCDEQQAAKVVDYYIGYRKGQLGDMGYHPRPVRARLL